MGRRVREWDEGKDGEERKGGARECHSHFNVMCLSRPV